MSPQTGDASAANMRGIGLVVLAMALLALSDLFIKLSARSLPVGQVMLLLSLGGTALFALLARWQGAPVRSPHVLHPMVIWRNVFEFFGAVGMVLGIAFVPLTTVAAIMQMAPLVVTLGGALLLKEKVGIRRWSAIAAGLCGMLLVVRPGMEGFTPSALFALMGITALALRDLVTRLCPRDLGSATLSVWGFASTIPAGLLMLAVMGERPILASGGLATTFAAVIVTTAGYYAITTAMRIAPASVVAPFRYSRLLFTMGLGITVFGERPDGWTLLGAAIILMAGLYTYMRERQVSGARPG